jgi:hypothetical protein
VKRKTQAESAREAVAAELRAMCAWAREIVRMWRPGHTRWPLATSHTYRRERARLLRVALRAVERAK